MPERLEVGLIERARGGLADILHRSPPGRYADLRIAVTENRWGASEDGRAKASGAVETGGLCARVVSADGQAAGFCGILFGEEEAMNLATLAGEAIRTATERAESNARFKRRAREEFGPLAESLVPWDLAPSSPVVRTVGASFKTDPRASDPAEFLALAREAASAARAHSGVDFASVTCATELTGSLFLSSEGSDILQLFPVTFVMVSLSAQIDGTRETLWDQIGDAAGIEVLTEGRNAYGLGAVAFADERAREVTDLCRAPACPTTDRPVTVVTDPSYNALLVHEIVGHPTEGDRAVKMETAYAGRTWLYRGRQVNQLGRRVASDLVTAFSDPTLPGIGHYEYDDEGMPGRRVVHIDRGTFRGFMNGRRTALLLGDEPNGHAKANRVENVPLIRMSNTCFAGGQTDPKDILAGVDHGYWLVGMRTPSIAESRENFRISARLTYEIRGGKVERLLRGGSMTSDSRDYLMSIDAVGDDFRIVPVLNCGKGQPMQSKKLGNGGPTLRGRARVIGPEGR